MVRACCPATAGNAKSPLSGSLCAAAHRKEAPGDVRSGTPSPISLAAASARERPPSPRRHL
jgi:hypothetical protein